MVVLSEGRRRQPPHKPRIPGRKGKGEEGGEGRVRRSFRILTGFSVRLPNLHETVWTRNYMNGNEVIDVCSNHILDVMSRLSECRPGAKGLGSGEIEEHAGLSLQLPYQDGWFTWSILHHLVQNGRIEAVRYPHGKTTRTKFRLP